MPLTSLNLSKGDQLRDLGPLQGMPLTQLSLGNCVQVRSLTPLRGAPLVDLRLTACGQVRDLSPLQGMPLTRLELCRSAVRDFTPLDEMNLRTILLPREFAQCKGLDVLRRLRMLETIGFEGEKERYPAVEFWKKFDVGGFK